jgi:hypothetical protein
VKTLALDDVRIASPCKMSWNDMVGDSQTRFCGGCRKSVYNLSAMTRDQAQALLDASSGDACVRLFRRSDGTVMTQDCKPVAAPARPSWARVGAGAALLPHSASADNAPKMPQDAVDGGTVQPPEPEPPSIMGGLRAPTKAKRKQPKAQPR